MLVRLIRATLLVLVAFALIATPSLAQSPRRIVAVGDLHGDYAAWLDIARAAGLIDARGRWAGAKTVLVQVGDVTDRGPDSLKIIRSLQQLGKQAPKAGGQVIVVLGNHEAMNLLGDFRYTTPGEFAAFTDADSTARRERAYDRNRLTIEAEYRTLSPGMTATAIHDAWIARTPLGWVEHRIAWAPTGELGRWAANNPAVAKVGDTLFVHGGLSAEYSAMPLGVINRRAREAMAGADDTSKSVLNDPLGPLWYRGLTGPDAEADAERGPAAAPRPTIDQELTTVLAAYGAKRIVIGHTPNLGGIVIASGGRLARIDTGISRYYGGQLSWLEIVGDRLVPHTVRRSGQ